MTTCNGVFIVSTVFCFEKPRLGNPYEAWAAGDQRGFRGFISTAGKFFKNDYQVDKAHQGHQKKYFQRLKKTIKTPKTPFSQSDREPLLLPNTTTYSNFYMENNNAY
jgi:hypothetical protein